MKFIGDETVNSVDLNSETYKETGWYILLGNSTNSPVNSGLILLEVFNSDNSNKGGESISIVQKVTTLSTGLPQYYIRTSWGAWNDWQRIDNFGYNSLAELAGGVAKEIVPNVIVNNSNLRSGKISLVANTPKEISLGSGMLFVYTGGAQAFYMIGINYWTAQCENIFTTATGLTFNKVASSKVVSITSSSDRTVAYVFIGE